MGRNRKWVLQDDIQEAVWRTILRGPRPPSHRWPLAQKSQKKSIQPRRNESAARQRGPAGQQPGQQPRRDARIADTGPNITPEAITEAAAVEVRRLEGAVAALGEESPHAKPLLTALKAAKAKLNVPISVQIESTTQYLERARKRLAQAEAEVARVTAQKDQCVADVEAAERRLERLQASAPSAMQQEPAELVQLQSRIDELIRERDSLQVSGIQGHVEVAASSTEEVNMLRANVDSLERERAMLRAEVARCRANADPSALMSTLIDQGDILARESGSSNRFNPLRQ